MDAKFNKNLPELLAPAGNLEKLKLAVNYGADAVYLAGQKFGLRSAADNFTWSELKEGVEYAHKHQVMAYIVLNSYSHDRDLEELIPFVRYCDELKLDAAIISDLGVLEIVKEHSSIPIHISTQASVLNSGSALWWN